MINMKKRVVGILLVFIVLFSFFVIAQSNETNDAVDSGVVGEEKSIEKAYRCLENQIDKKDSLALEESVFSVLAMGSNNKLDKSISDEKSSESECWPSSGCNIKNTAQVLLAYERVGKSTDEIEKWLLLKEMNAKDLIWYLETDITNHEASACTIKYGSEDRGYNIKEDMTLDGNPGSCLGISYGGYWLKVKDSCLDSEFVVSCDKEFVTALAYQRVSGGTVYVSSNAQSGASLGTTNVKVNSKCFGIGNKCDYEGTLWAALALNEIGYDISAYIPYLLALSENNGKFFPDSFLHILTGGEDQYRQVIQKQNEKGYWDIAGGENRFYDTSLGMLSLRASYPSDIDSTKNYLLSAQTNEGCWNNNNIRDTGFILYSGWYRGVNQGGGGGGTTSCVDFGFYCGNRFKCAGDLLNNYDCSDSGVGLECCSEPFEKDSCSEIGGEICGADEKCSKQIESSSDGACCTGTCEVKVVENECRINVGGVCRSDCNDDEDRKNEICPDSGDVCCVEKDSPAPSEGISLWIWILIILILLVILGIVFRNKIRVWVWKRKGKARVGGVPRPPRGPPSGLMAARPAPRFGSQMARRPSGNASPKDKEMEETMRKLREMGK